MTAIKMESALPKSGGHTAIADRLWNDLGGSYIIVAEVHVSERTEPEPDDDQKEPSAKLRVVQLEISEVDGPDGLAILDRLNVMRHRRVTRGTLLDGVDPETGEIKPEPAPVTKPKGGRRAPAGAR